MTANRGTPTIIPTSPQMLPKNRMENRIQKLDIPTVSPRILGPRTLPSTCCSRIIKTRNTRHFHGLDVRISRADGIMPM